MDLASAEMTRPVPENAETGDASAVSGLEYQSVG